jgi:hypothetical protein
MERDEKLFGNCCLPGADLLIEDRVAALASKDPGLKPNL